MAELVRGKITKVAKPATQEEKQAMRAFMARTRGATLYEVASTKPKYKLEWHPATLYRVAKA